MGLRRVLRCTLLAVTALGISGCMVAGFDAAAPHSRAADAHCDQRLQGLWVNAKDAQEFIGINPQCELYLGTDLGPIEPAIPLRTGEWPLPGRDYRLAWLPYMPLLKSYAVAVSDIQLRKQQGAWSEMPTYTPPPRYAGDVVLFCYRLNDKQDRLKVAPVGWEGRMQLSSEVDKKRLPGEVHLGSADTILPAGYVHVGTGLAEMPQRLRAGLCDFSGEYAKEFQLVSK
ncbi:hypothetical protein CO611_05195 [Lysobacteraceae bacterium NML03-0222]|nr:hypothetical protein CO611_05195 [Xanthomonadaceae bacterium NML03-0222]